MDELLRDLARLPGRVGDAVRRAVRASAEAVEADAAPNVPERTGHLKGELDIQYENGGLVARVGYTDAQYGWFTEFGTSTMPAQPALIPAAERERPKLPDRARDELARELRS